MTKARTRSGTGVWVLCALLIVGTGLWIAKRRADRPPAMADVSDDGTASLGRVATTIASPSLDDGHRRGDSAAGARAPHAAPDASSAPTVEGMPPGLAQDLEMFNSDQLRAELESIALSYPAVTLVTAICPTRPCQARIASQDVEQLNQYAEMVNHRFQGHVATQFEIRPAPEGSSTLYASFTIGTPVRHPLARYTPAP